MASRTIATRSLQVLLSQRNALRLTKSSVLMSKHPTSFNRAFVGNDVRWFSDNSSKEAPGTTANEDSSTAEETPQEPSANEPIKELSREEQLEAEVKALKDQWLRSLAEQDNIRRIAKKDVEDARQFAIKSFAKSLLDVSDNLVRALDAVPEEVRRDKEGNAVLANLYEGIEMTEKSLAKAFEMNGLTKYGEPGDTFDPNLHEALYEYPDPNQEPGTIGQVMKKGFMLHKRVLRPAEVGIIKKP